MCRYCGTPLDVEHVGEYHGDLTERELDDLYVLADEYQELVPLGVAA